MSDFDDRPFVAGEVIGLRAFAVNDGGRLAGVTKRRCVWTEGENTAACLANPLERAFARMAKSMHIAVTSPGLRGYPFGAPTPTTPPDPSEHRVAGLDCTCGFYAYFDGHNDYLDAPCACGKCAAIAGVIRGYGIVTVGSRGFRAQKAELVALIKPARRRPRWLSRLRRHDLATLLGLLATLAVMGLYLVDGPDRFDAATMVAYAGAWGWILARWHTQWKSRPTGIGRTPGRKEWAQVRAAYPNVPVYRSQKAALAAHPLTVPPPANDGAAPDGATA